MILILIGPPGSGKSTQCQLLVDTYRLPFLSVGEIIRQALLTEEFSAYRQKVEAGNLLPDEIVLSIIRNKFNNIDLDKGFVMEGFPRTVGQASWIDDFLENKGFKVDKVIYLDNMGTETIKKRILSRHQCNQCKRVFAPDEIHEKGFCPLCHGTLYDRQDDQESVLENRIEQYHRQSYPVKEYYQEKKALMAVDASKSIQEVFQNILNQLNNEPKNMESTSSHDYAQK